MVTPAKGDYESVPITLEAKKIGDAWDPAKDEAAGEQCRAYGAPAIMAVPTRLRITWQDDKTLKVETDAGIQTRLFHFGLAAPKGPPSWQGESVAEWERARGRDADRRLAHRRDEERAARLLRKNGVPYSASAVLTDIGISDRNRRRPVDHPHQCRGRSQYLRVPYITALQFKKKSMARNGIHAVLGR
jgi:hypothetical protein